jgi:hypothetical protein
VNTRTRQSGVVCGDEAYQRLGCPGGQQKTGATSQQRKQDALDERVPNDLPRARTECHPDGDLALPARRALQQEVGDVGARNEQDQPHNHHQNLERRFVVLAQRCPPLRARLDVDR